MRAGGRAAVRCWEQALPALGWQLLRLPPPPPQARMRSVVLCGTQALFTKHAIAHWIDYGARVLRCCGATGLVVAVVVAVIVVGAAATVVVVVVLAVAVAPLLLMTLTTAIAMVTLAMKTLKTTGTLLGLARHNGTLIPWDYDADIGVMIFDFNKMLGLRQEAFDTCACAHHIHTRVHARARANTHTRARARAYTPHLPNVSVSARALLSRGS